MTLDVGQDSKLSLRCKGRGKGHKNDERMKEGLKKGYKDRVKNRVQKVAQGIKVKSMQRRAYCNIRRL